MREGFHDDLSWASLPVAGSPIVAAPDLPELPRWHSPPRSCGASGTASPRATSCGHGEVDTPGPWLRAWIEFQVDARINQAFRELLEREIGTYHANADGACEGELARDLERSVSAGGLPDNTDELASARAAHPADRRDSDAISLADQVTGTGSRTGSLAGISPDGGWSTLGDSLFVCTDGADGVSCRETTDTLAMDLQRLRGDVSRHEAALAELQTVPEEVARQGLLIIAVQHESSKRQTDDEGIVSEVHRQGEALREMNQSLASLRGQLDNELESRFVIMARDMLVERHSLEQRLLSVESQSASWREDVVGEVRSASATAAADRESIHRDLDALGAALRAELESFTASMRGESEARQRQFEAQGSAMRSKMETLNNSTRNELESRVGQLQQSLAAAEVALEGAERRLEEMRGEDRTIGEGSSLDQRLVFLEERFDAVQAGLASAESLLVGSQERFEEAWGEAAAAEQDRSSAIKSLQASQVELHQRLDETMRGITERIRSGQAAWGAHLTQTHEKLARALADDMRSALRSEASAMATMDEELLLSDLRVEERLHEIAAQSPQLRAGRAESPEGSWPVLELKSPSLRPAAAAVLVSPAREPKHRGYTESVMRPRSFPRAAPALRAERRSWQRQTPTHARSSSSRGRGAEYSSVLSSPGQYVPVSAAHSPEPVSSPGAFAGGGDLKGTGGAAAVLRRWLGTGGAALGGTAAR